MEIPERISRDSEVLTRLYNSSSKSMKKRILYDFDFLKSIAEELDTKIYTPNYKIVYDESLFMYQIEKYIDDLEVLAEIVIDLYKKIDFYFYNRFSYIDFSKKDMEDLLKEFFQGFSPEMLFIYNEMLENNRIDFTEMHGSAGESFFLNNISSYYVLFNDGVKSKLLFLETIIHELCHIYSNKFLKNYRYNGLKNLQEGFFGETISLYSELSFYEFLVSKGFSKIDLALHRNVLDYLILTYFKTINYVAKVSARTDIEMLTDNVNYRAIGNNRLDIEEIGSIYEYTPYFYNGNLQDFRYGPSTIEAFHLLKLEEKGISPSRIINSYLIGFQNDNMMDDFLESELDLGYMFKKINERNQVLRKVYPINK